MIAYMCKRFVSYPGRRGARGEGYWIVLGTVYAESSQEARREAARRWGQVDSVYCLDGID